MSTQGPESKEFVVKATCAARRGIIAAVTGYLSERDCYISELSQFDDQDTGRFFMRAVCHVETSNHKLGDICKQFSDVAIRFDMQCEFHQIGIPVKVLIMVSKFDHCLANLLYRLRKGELNMEITAVVSNHLDLRPMIEREGIRFIYLPMSKASKDKQEQVLRDVIRESDTELIVLARYMQILSEQLCSDLEGRVINIHHSFLPGFKGAKPYHQAFDRGVKLIGATAHYVTSDLDEGPIIQQSVQPVDHTYSPADLVTVGRDTETNALASAVRLHIEHRVFLDGNKTVVFN